MHVDRIANELGRHRRGLVLRRSLVAAGVAERTTTARVSGGVWALRGVGGGVVDLLTHPDDWHKEVLAEVLGGPTGALASHRTAGFLHGFLDVRQPATIELTVPRSTRNHDTVVRCHSSTAPDDGTRVDGVPVTRWPRTVRDLVPVLHPTHVHRIVAQCLRRRSDAPRLLVAELESCSRTAAGVGLFRRVLEAELGSDRVLLESPLEDIGHRALDLAGMPPERVQLEVERDGRVLARLDFAWPSVMHAWELDGRDHHMAEPDRRSDDGRDARLRMLGWTVDRVTSADLRGAARARTLARLRARLDGRRRRSAEVVPRSGR